MRHSRILLFAIISLLQATSAQPHRRHAHQVQHAKKHVVTITETYIAKTTTWPQVVVFVDQSGHPVSTVTQTLPTNIHKVIATGTTVATLVAAVPTLVESEIATYTIVTSTTPVVVDTTPVPPASSSAAVVEPAQSTAPVFTSRGYGLAYNPYNRDTSCKDAAQVLSDFAAFEEYGLIRTYGTDCNTITNVYAACKATGKMLFAGIFSLDGLSDEVANIVTGIKGDWSAMHTISVGNELVNQGKASAIDVMAAVSTARQLLRAAGYRGPVVTVDTFEATKKNLILCDESDYCAINAHPFFDPTATAISAGKWLSDVVKSLKSKQADSSQKIVITETGWPSQASANGAAKASSDLQKAAIDSIKAAFSPDPSGVILLSAYNRQWLKDDVGKFGQEYWFGIMGDCPSG